MKRISRSAILVFTILIISLTSACASNLTPVISEPPETNDALPTQVVERNASPEPLTDQPLRLTEIEKRLGFDVQEPAYLPEGVYFDAATYQEAPHSSVTLQFNLVHEQYGDVGRFFLITQQDGALSNPCDSDCEALQIGDIQVKYRLNKSADNPGADTEMLTWESAGFSFQLLRTAGEPNKTYKDELLKVVGSMK